MPRHVREERKREAAIQAGRRMVSRGERPGYRLTAAQAGSWTVVGLPGVTVTAETKRTALAAARAVITAVLEVDPESFEVEA